MLLACIYTGLFVVSSVIMLVVVELSITWKRDHKPLSKIEQLERVMEDIDYFD
jgi:hypothetical protein